MIEAVTVWVALTLGGDVPILELGGHVAVAAPMHDYGWVCGTSWVPHVSTVDARCGDHVLPHESRHQEDHWESLGPGFPIAYALTLGRPFENYHDSHWSPPDEMRRACPLLRMAETAVLAPCYR